MIKKSFLLVIASITQLGCDVPASTSNDWLNTINAKENECPDITGTYSIMDEPGYIVLGGHSEEMPKKWAIMSISGNPQQELHITLYEAKTGFSNTEPIKRTLGRDYQCKDGWLDTYWPSGAYSENMLDDSIPENDQFEKSLSFVKNKMGELVIRKNTRTWSGIAVWCGDGCKYLPIPFTSRTRHQYSRWPSSPIPVVSAPINKSIAPDTNVVAPEPDFDDDTPEGRAARVLTNLLPAHTKLVRIINTGTNQFKATFQGGTNSLLALHEELQTTADIQIIDLKIDSSSPIKEVAMEFRLAPTKAELEAKRAGEAAKLELAKQHEAAQSALVRRLLPSMPKEMVITFSHLDTNGFLVELRHKDEEAFHQLLVNTIASGEFVTADIKTRKASDNYGRHVIDVLFIPRLKEMEY